MSCIYALKSLKDSRFYIGSTRLKPGERLKAHNRGAVRSTKGRKPFDLIYSEEYDSYAQAKKKELFKLIDDKNRAGTQVAKGDRL